MYHEVYKDKICVRRKWLEDQYKSYINRFGPGLVIYWHGYLKDIELVEQDVMILDSFPSEKQRIIQLPRVNLEDP